jgi:hypothetical protein
MTTANGLSDLDYAKILKDKVEAFKRREEAREAKKRKVESAFQSLIEICKGFFDHCGLSCIIAMNEQELEYEIPFSDPFKKDEAITTRFNTLFFSCDYVSVRFAPKDQISSGWFTAKDTIIDFVLIPDLKPHVDIDFSTMTAKPGADYQQSPDEIYKLNFSETDGWSVTVSPKNRPQGATDLLLNNDSLSRIFHSFFSSVLAGNSIT